MSVNLKRTAIFLQCGPDHACWKKKMIKMTYHIILARFLKMAPKYIHFTLGIVSFKGPMLYPFSDFSSQTP